MRDLGRPRANIDGVFDEIIDVFNNDGYGEPPKSKLKNLEILAQILSKIGFTYEKDDEASLAKGRHRHCAQRKAQLGEPLTEPAWNFLWALTEPAWNFL